MHIPHMWLHDIIYIIFKSSIEIIDCVVMYNIWDPNDDFLWLHIDLCF